VSAPSSPLRTAIALAVGAALFSVLMLFGYAILRGELAQERELADAHRVEAVVLAAATETRRARVRYAIDGREIEAELDDRGTTPREPGARLAIEVARHDLQRAVLRVGPPDYVLPWILMVCGLVPTAVCGWNAWNTRRRLPLLPRRDPRVATRVLAALPELGFAALFAGIWLAPGAFPRGLVEGIEWSLLLEAMLEITGCLALPMLLAPGPRAPRIIAGAVVVGLLLKVTAFFAQVAGAWAWIMLATLLASRGALLHRDRGDERVHQLDRWAHGLVLLLLAFVLAHLANSVLALPPAGVARAAPAEWVLPSAITLAWGLAYYLLQALARVLDWPRRRVDGSGTVRLPGVRDRA